MATVLSETAAEPAGAVAEPELSPRPGRTLLLAGALIFITFLAYLPTLQNGYIWDDDDYVTHNMTLRTLEGLKQIWFQPGATPQYYPLVHSTFWIEYHLWELAPRGYHVVNVLLHGAGAALLWLLLGRLAVPGAWLAAAIFALHPVHVESVAWVTERKNVLSGLFYFAAALAYMRFALGNVSRGRLWAYAAALALFLCALLSKTVTCSLPAAVLVVLWWKRGRIGWKDVLPLLPFFALGIGFGLLTANMEKTRVGATGKEWDFTFVERCLIAGRALWFYATKLLLPTKLAFIYPRWTIDQSTGWLYLFPAAFLALAGTLLALRRRIGRGPLAATLLFAGTLFPALGFFNVYPMRYSFVADHFQYHASASLIALFAAGLVLAARKLGQVPRPAVGAAAGVLLAVYGGLSWSQTKIYRDYATVWEDTLKKNPTSTIALTSVASVRVGGGQTEEAMVLYRQALEIAPEDDVANFNLGKLLAEQGKNEEALKYLKASISASPECSHCHYFYAATLAQMGRQQESIPHYEKALQIGPPEPFLHYNYGVTLDQLDKPDEAAKHYREALALEPALGFAHFGLRDLLLRQMKAAEAETFFQEFVQKHPDGAAEAYVALGDSIMTQQKPEKFGSAAKAFEQALRLRPGWEEAAGRLNAVKQMLGQ